MIERGFASTLVLALASAGLTACGGGGSPTPTSSTPTPTATASPTPSPTPTPTPPASGATQVVTSDIQYGQGATASGDIDLFLDIYAPDEACDTNRPTVVFVHGGGFTSGNKSGGNISAIAEEITARGINLVSIQYRLDPQDPLPSQAFVDVVDDIVSQSGGNAGDERLDAIAAAFEDTVSALNFLEANQDNLCVDTSRLAYWGSSAGAFTVLQVGYGLNQFGIARPEPEVVVDYWGGLFRDSDLEMGEAPFLVIHGTADATVDFAEAQQITNRAGVVAVPFALYTVNGAGHGFGATGTFTNTVDGQTLLERTVDFVEAHLTGGTPIYGRFDVTP